MKKILIGISAIGMAMFLLIAFFNGHVDGVREEKARYIKNLDFEFSGRLDSAERPGQVLFQVINGKLDRDKERELGAKLEHNGVIEPLLYRPDGKLDLMIPDPHHFRQGDSLYLNSSKNLVAFYRNGKLLSGHSLVKSLRGRPFRIPILEDK